LYQKVVNMRGQRAQAEEGIPGVCKRPRKHPSTFAGGGKTTGKVLTKDAPESRGGVGKPQ